MMFKFIWKVFYDCVSDVRNTCTCRQQHPFVLLRNAMSHFLTDVDKIEWKLCTTEWKVVLLVEVTLWQLALQIVTWLTIKSEFILGDQIPQATFSTFCEIQFFMANVPLIHEINPSCFPCNSSGIWSSIGRWIDSKKERVHVPYRVVL